MIADFADLCLYVYVQAAKDHRRSGEAAIGRMHFRNRRVYGPKLHPLLNCSDRTLATQLLERKAGPIVPMEVTRIATVGYTPYMNRRAPRMPACVPLHPTEY